MADTVARVLVVDDHPLWAETIGRIIERRGAGQIVGSAATAAEALDLGASVDPDVVIMDLELPDGSGIDVTAELLEICPDARVLILSASNDRAQVLAAMQAGAMGYLVKTTGADEVADAVDRIRQGELALPPGLSDVLLDEFRRLRSSTDPSPSGPATRRGTFRQEAGVWVVGFGDELAHVKDLKGLSHIGALLAVPGREVHVTELAGAVDGASASSTSAAGVAGALGVHSGRLGDAGPVLDAEAKRAYRERLAELEADIQEAEEFADDERRARAQAEHDALVEQLAGAVGLGGRDRRAADNTERARTAVGRAIRRAITRIGEVQPDLAHHLDRSITTGTYCRYAPEQPIDWDR